VKESGFTVLALSWSPVRGPEGNIEYLGWLRKAAWEEKSFDLTALVEASHEELENRQ
jgi:23S rRNA (cytidine1920-2'-O)/16S rRNA (cytidine1409-2'-O)-methyltransferase